MWFELNTISFVPEEYTDAKAGDKGSVWFLTGRS